jgi:tagaturonate reductase
MSTPILQFGTSRFLQAHADLFIDEAMAKAEALGPITVVQTTGAPERAGRVATLAAADGYPVRLRGRADGVDVDREQRVKSVRRALSTSADWAAVEAVFVSEAAVILSNTGDTGYRIPEDDLSGDVPKSFPGKLLALLSARFQAGGGHLTILPCELVARNGDTLKQIVLGLQVDRFPDSAFRDWLQSGVVWGNSLVDRIVSEPIDPAGAVCEPYALWAIERQPGLVIPCTHPAIKLVDDLAPYEKLKLHILNLGHTVLADIWLKDGRRADETVREILADTVVFDRLTAIYRDEVVPAFAARGLGGEAETYVATTLERFQNPYLDHRIADIAANHAEKVKRRIEGLKAWSPSVAMPALSAIATQ